MNNTYSVRYPIPDGLAADDHYLAGLVDQARQHCKRQGLDVLEVREARVVDVRPEFWTYTDPETGETTPMPRQHLSVLLRVTSQGVTKEPSTETGDDK